MDEEVTFRSRGRLPHIEKAGSIYFVTFRLYGSVPSHVLQEWLVEKEIQRKKATDSSLQEMNFILNQKIDRYLDSGYGDCWLRRSEIASVVASAFHYFNEKRYFLYAYSIMPNHVHVLFGTSQPTLIPIMHSWKSFTAKEANRILGRSGKFWQEEYFDTIVKSDREFAYCIRYTLHNPVKAGLCKQWQDWKWNWCTEEIRRLLEDEEGGQDARAPKSP